MHIMDISAKASLIDDVLGFYLQSPIMDAAVEFPSPEYEIDNWYNLALAFERVRSLAETPKQQWRDLFDLVEDAASEIKAARILGEAPDLHSDLGAGYDIDQTFVAKHQALIWDVVTQIYLK